MQLLQQQHLGTSASAMLFLILTTLLSQVARATLLPVPLNSFELALSEISSNYNNNETSPNADSLSPLYPRGGCGSNYGSCVNAGAPQLCCTTTAVCSADYMGKVGCCPLGAACTGVVGNQGMSTIAPNGGGATSVDAQPTATSASSQGFVQADGTTVVILGQSAANGLRVPWVFKGLAVVCKALNVY